MGETKRNPILIFGLRTVAWLPPCFAAWYLVSDWHGRLVAWIARFFISLDGQGLVAALEFGDRVVSFVTRVEIHTGGHVAIVTPEVRPLIYTFGLPLFVGLMLAAKANWKPIVAGVILLLPFQAWSVAFDVLAQLVIRSGYEATMRSGFSSNGREFIALGYQLGTLILPTVVPVLLWGWFERKFVAEQLMA